MEKVCCECGPVCTEVVNASFDRNWLFQAQQDAEVGIVDPRNKARSIMEGDGVEIVGVMEP